MLAAVDRHGSEGPFVDVDGNRSSRSRSEDRVQGQPLLDDLHGYAGDGGDVFGFTDVVGREAFVVVYGPLFGLG